MVGLVLISLLPGFTISVAMVYHAYERDKARVNSEAIGLAKSLSATLDRELSETLSGLQVLATARALTVGKLDVFQAHAIRALQYQSATNFSCRSAIRCQIREN